MKTPLLVLAAAVLALSACKILEDLGGTNTHDTYIEIPPGTQIPPDDQKKLVTILSKYDKRLYWVWDINKKDNVGQLSCVYVHETLLDEVLKGLKVGNSYSSIQIGARSTMSNCDNTHHTPSLHTSQVHHTPMNVHNTQRSHHTPFLHHTPHLTASSLKDEDYRESRALVKEVTPILEKYTHK